MTNKNSTTQIWADGYSFMEVTETLMMALGIRSDDGASATPEPQRVEPTPPPSYTLASDALADR